MSPTTTPAPRIPVTVLTGFLGSGKTTLLNRILTEQHGRRIAVIENEFGEVGVDNELVVNADEEIFEMNNGCICCTVRGDLIRILGNLAKRRDRFDSVLIETTGLADPGPVAQTFFVDEEVREQFRRRARGHRLGRGRQRTG
jgi:G3E family GTPase